MLSKSGCRNSQRKYRYKTMEEKTIEELITEAIEAWDDPEYPDILEAEIYADTE